MTLTYVTDCMKAYNDIINDSHALVDYFSQGTYFEYTKPLDIVNSTHIHAYAGINNDKKLAFFMIPSEYDTEATPHVETHVAECELLHLYMGGNILPDVVAQEMCERWDENYETWIPEQVEFSAIGMFLAFKIPVEDFQEAVVRVNLALKMHPTALTSMVADVVVSNFDGTDVYNYDFAGTVPPYPASLNNYYLLSLI